MQDSFEIDGLVKRGQSKLAARAREFAETGYVISGELTKDTESPEQAKVEPNVRKFEYRGHTVRIVTRYEITIDNQPWEQNLQVLQNGTVHYHGLPQANLSSAVDMMKAVIDTGFEAPREILNAKAGK